MEKSREMARALGIYRDRMKDVSANLLARANHERQHAEQVSAEARRREIEAQARIDAETGRREAILEEERARLRAEFEEERGRLEAALDAERAGLQARWREQAELLEMLRKARGPNPES